MHLLSLKVNRGHFQDHCKILQNIAQCCIMFSVFLPLPATLGIPLPTFPLLPSPHTPPTPFSPGLPPLCPPPHTRATLGHDVLADKNRFPQMARFKVWNKNIKFKLTVALWPVSLL